MNGVQAAVRLPDRVEGGQLQSDSDEHGYYFAIGPGGLSCDQVLTRWRRHGTMLAAMHLQVAAIHSQLL